MIAFCPTSLPSPTMPILLRVGILATAAHLCSGCYSASTSFAPSTELRRELRIGNSAQKVALELGSIQPGSTNSTVLRVANDSEREITIDRFQSSCECTRLLGLPVRVRGFGVQELLLCSDFSHDGKFAGALRVNIDLYDSLGAHLGSAIADMTVAPATSANER
jgi:hypothetical protein